MQKNYFHVLDLGLKSCYNNHTNTNKCLYFNISTGKKNYKKGGDLGVRHQKMSSMQAKLGVESFGSGGQFDAPP